MMTSSMSFSGRMMRDLLTVTLPVVAAMLILPSLYSNHLLLFNFVMFMTLAQGLNVIYGFTGILPLGYVGFFGAGAYGFAMAVMHLKCTSLHRIRAGRRGLGDRRASFDPVARSCRERISLSPTWLHPWRSTR